MKQELTPIKAVIIDPDGLSRVMLSDEVERQSGFDILACVSNGVEGLNEIRDEHPDIVLVEVDLPDMTAFQLMHQVSPAVRPIYILTSHSDTDAVKAFEYFVFDYLLKPLSSARLQLSLIKARERIYSMRQEQLHEKMNALFRYLQPSRARNELPTNGLAQLLPVKMSGRIYFLRPGQIEFIEAAGYYIEVFAHGKRHLMRQSLTQLDSMLDPHHFVRIHRSVIINVDFLKEIIRDGANDFSVRMANDATFKISRSYKPDVFTKIGL